jgi:quercetin dioxygenase-like cupin family protein
LQPTLVRHVELLARQLEHGADVMIILDSEEGAENLAMGKVVFQPGVKTKPHTRDVEEVLFVLAGQGTVVTEDAVYTLDEGDSLLIPPGVRHRHENRGTHALHQLYIFAPQGPEVALRTLS